MGSAAPPSRRLLDPIDRLALHQHFPCRRVGPLGLDGSIDPVLLKCGTSSPVDYHDLLH
jgi:hypothetical protein